MVGAKDSLVKNFELQTAGTPSPEGRAINGPWHRVRFGVVLAPADA